MSRQRVAIVVLLVLSATAFGWTSPPSRRPASIKPVSNKKFEFRPAHWAAAGIMAASIAFSPLPSVAAADNTAVAGDSVQVKVEGNSLVIKLDLPELKVGAVREALGAGKLKATVKQVPTEDDVVKKSEPITADEATSKVKEEPKVAEKTLVEKVTQALSIPNSDEKKEERDAAPENKEAPKENAVVASQKSDESSSTVVKPVEKETGVEPKSEEPKPVEKTMMEKVSEALSIAPSDDKKEESNAVPRVAAETKEVKAPSDDKKEQPKAPQGVVVEKKDNSKDEPTVVSPVVKKEEPKVEQQPKIERPTVENKMEPPDTSVEKKLEKDANKDEPTVVSPVVKKEEPKVEQQPKIERSTVQNKMEAPDNPVEKKLEKKGANKDEPTVVSPVVKKEEPKVEQQPKIERPTVENKMEATDTPVEKKSEPAKVDLPKADVKEQEEAKKASELKASKQEEKEEKLSPPAVEAEVAPPKPVMKREEPIAVEEQRNDVNSKAISTSPSVDTSKVEEPETEQRQVVEKKEEPAKETEVKPSVEQPKAEVPEKESVAPTQTVVVEPPKEKEFPVEVQKVLTPVETGPKKTSVTETEAQKSVPKLDVPKDATKALHSFTTPFGSKASADKSDVPVLRKLWDDFVADHTESEALASRNAYGDVPYWERPAFRATIQKKMDGKGDLRLVFSNLDAARASVVVLGVASAVNFAYLRPLTKQDAKEGEVEKKALPDSTSTQDRRSPYLDQRATSENTGPSRRGSDWNTGYPNASLSSSPVGLDSGVPDARDSNAGRRQRPSDTSYSETQDFDRPDEINTARGVNKNGTPGEYTEYKPDIGIIYYPDDMTEEQRMREGTREAKRDWRPDDVSNDSYLDNLSNVNGSNKQGFRSDRRGNTFPFSNENQHDSF